MADDKASDLDVFEGLTKKKESSHAPPSLDGGGVPSAPPTMRGGTGAPSARVLPPPKRPSESALPKPSGPPSKRPSSSALPKPKPPPSKRPSSSPPGSRESDAPVLSIKPATGKLSGMGAAFDEPSGSILPGSAVADLDWDDEEEATNVFDRSASDLFGDLAGKPRSVSAPSRPTPSMGNAAALLASSGRSAQSLPVPSVPLPGAMSAPPMSMPMSGPMSGPMSAPMAGPVTVPSLQQPLGDMPKIPAPAPVPRDISQSDAGVSDAPAARAPHPSWAPAAPAPPMAPPQRSSASTILLALVAVLVLGAAAFFYLRSSSAAAVVIAVTHEGNAVDQANIYVDGQKKCEFAPCKLEMKPGTKVIRVVSGNLAGSKTINVEGGKDLQVAIALGLTDEVAPPTSDSATPSDDKPASLTLASAMKDVDIQVSVNGEDKGKLPVDLSDLKPGSYRLVFSGGDKYGNLEKTVELKAGDTLKIDDIKLPLAKVEVSFSLGTRGAKVVLVEKDGDQEKETALAFRGNKAEQTLDTKKTWLVKATLKGYQDFEKQLEFPEGEDKMTFDIELEKESATPPPVAAVDPQPNTKTPDPQPPPGDSGFINANSIPPSKVIIDGVPKGSTPVTGVKVAPGSHTVVFRHAELGTESRTVTVAPGQTKTATVRFKAKEEPKPESGDGSGSGDGGGKKKKKKKKSSDE